jgi:hypothetical protein
MLASVERGNIVQFGACLIGLTKQATAPGDLLIL